MKESDVNPQKSLHLASDLKAKGELAAAEATLKSLIAQHPKFVAAYNNLGAVYFAQGKYAEAVSVYQVALDLQPNYADVYYNLGLSFAKLNRLLEAVNAFDALLTLIPTHVGALFQLGRLRMQQEKYELAMHLFSDVLAQFPEHTESQVNLGTCFLKQGQLASAKNHYLNALSSAPDDVQVLFNLGVLSMQQNNMAEALAYYLRVVNIDADHFDAHNNLAFIYLGMRDIPTALSHYQAALHLQPNNVALKHTIQILKQDKNITSSPIEYVRALFDSYADHFDVHLTQTLHYQTPQLLVEMMHQHITTPTTTWDVLDLGCGTGLSGEGFKGKVHTLVGVDISEKMLAVAAQKNIYNELVLTDILSFLQNKRDCYDLVIAADTLVYFGDLQEAFTLINQALKQKGLFLFNLEISASNAFQMTESGRFAHSKQYITEIAMKVGLICLEVKAATLRIQNKQPVEGYLYLFARQIVTC